VRQFLFYFLFLTPCLVFCQQVSQSTTTSAYIQALIKEENTSIHFSASIGEAVIGVLNNQRLSISQGYLQPILDITTEIVHETPIHLKIYPNPIKDHFFIESQGYKISKVEIYNLNGAKLLDHQLKYDKKVDIKNLMPGLYKLFIFTDKGRISIQKIIKI